MLDALGLGCGVVTSVTFQKVDNAPHGKARAKRDNKGLQGIDSRRKELHVSTSIFIFILGIKKPPFLAAGHFGPTWPEVMELILLWEGRES
jgi:hypothetical protein